MYVYLVFFPVYPYLVKAFHLIISDYRIAALLVSVICYVIGICYFYGAICLEFGEDIAKKAAVYLSIFPFSFYYGSIMTESTFLMMCAMCFYYTKKHKWIVSGVIGFFASLTRVQGILLLIILFCEWMEYKRPIEDIINKKYKKLFGNALPVIIGAVLTLLGLGVYFLINYKIAGDPLIFLDYQRDNWNNQGQFFAKTIADVWGRSFNGGLSGQLQVMAGYVPVFLIVLSVVLLGYSLFVINSKYILFYAFYVITCYSHGWLISSGRYMSAAFPMFIIMAVFSRKHEKVDKLLVVTSAMLYGVILFEFLTWKHVY